MAGRLRRRCGEWLDIGLCAQDYSEARTHQNLVVGKQGADHRSERSGSRTRGVAALGAGARLELAPVDGDALAQGGTGTYSCADGSATRTGNGKVDRFVLELTP